MQSSITCRVHADDQCGGMADGTCHLAKERHDSHSGDEMIGDSTNMLMGRLHLPLQSCEGGKELCTHDEAVGMHILEEVVVVDS